MLLAAVGPAQSGGNFSITQSVIAGGGDSSSGSVFSVAGTAGQSVAGTTSTGGNFTIRDGFWTPTFTLTAAMVSISGRVQNQDGRGVRNAAVTLTNASVTRVVLTGPMGEFRFDDIEAGNTYMVSVRSRRFQFEPRIVEVNDDVAGLVFMPVQ